MKQRFTEADILRFIYNEMSPRESSEFLDALCNDEQLWEQFETYQQISDQVSQVAFHPSDASCQHIMDFVSDTSPVTHTQLHTGRRKRKNRLNTILMSALIALASGTVAASVYHVMSQEVNVDDGISHQAAPSVILDWEDDLTEQQLQEIKEEIQEIRNTHDKPSKKQTL